jgi:RimJ/RimL family protein N-acetyltransferase
MGLEEDYSSRSWASWRAFHSDEPTSDYDHDFSWYKNIQTAPLYRRDLDLVVIHNNEIVSFCTIFYDDYTRSAVTVVVGTASEYWQQGLAKAVIIEGMHRLKSVGCTRVFATSTEEPAKALYASVMDEMKVTDTWFKEL